METWYDVLKFGGSCLSSAEDFAGAARIVSSHANPVVVVSAISGITDMLTNLCRSESFVDAMETIDNIQRVHLDAMSRITRRNLREASLEELRKLFQELINLTMDSRPGESAEKVALVLSYGERLSAVVLKWHLLNLNLPASVVFSSDLIVAVDEDLLEASVDMNWSRELIRHGIEELRDRGEISIITGFFCRTPSGKTAILGRNSSDYTAALVSGSLVGSRLTFWKDVPGLMTGDPKFVKECTVLRQISYDEADGYINNGARILHSKVISIARENRIPVSIRDFRNPDTPGTLISSSPEPDDASGMLPG